MYEYRAKILRVVDGDTVDVDIDLGFGIVLANERVRIMGIDTPESRTSDKTEKVFGLAAKARLKNYWARPPSSRHRSARRART
jgi:micrococcal nuclease